MGEVGGAEWKHGTGACLTFSCSTCSGFSSFCTEWGGAEELMMIDIWRPDGEGRVNSRKA